MRLNSYLEQLLGSRASVRILRTLFKYKGMVFTVRRLAETANVSHTEANQTIDKLEKFGVVKVQPVGKAYQISLNEKSYILANVLSPIFSTESRTRQALVTLLKETLSRKKIISAAIFGSVAAGKERDDSDIDLVVISNDKDLAYSVVGNAITQVSEIFHGKLAPIVFSKKEFIDRKQSDLVKSILGSHIMVAGTDLKEIIK
ncbi:MAG: nucleotidyltransferase domain-containing protein [Thaumarchaeota archaeon]|nr:nucleotidyltransferase domain-containing protein [Nitrososphaerota archaeon]